MIWLVDMDVLRNLLAWNLGYNISVMMPYSLAGRYRHFQKYNFLNFRYKFTHDVTISGTWLRTLGVSYCLQIQDKTVRSWYHILWLLGTDVSGNLLPWISGYKNSNVTPRNFAEKPATWLINRLNLDGGCRCVRNVATSLPNYTASHSRRSCSWHWRLKFKCHNASSTQ
jgi:hypothetical protein